MLSTWSLQHAIACYVALGDWHSNKNERHLMQASPSRLHGLGDLLPSRRKKNHWQLVNPCNVTCILSFDRHIILSQRHPFKKQEIEIQTSKQSSQVYKDGEWQSSDFKQFIWDVLFLTHQKIKSCFFNRHSLIQTYYREVLSLSNRPPWVDIKMSLEHGQKWSCHKSVTRQTVFMFISRESFPREGEIPSWREGPWARANFWVQSSLS